MRVLFLISIVCFGIIGFINAQSVFKYEALPSVQSLYDAELVDLNADGHKDFIISTSSSLVWHENDGAASFVEHNIQGMNSSCLLYTSPSTPD